MSNLFHIDHKVLAGGLLAVTTSWALYTSWKLWLMKRKKHEENYLETFNYLHENLLQQYGSEEEILGQWSELLDERFLNLRLKCVGLCKKHVKNHQRALDVNCGVGRSAFGLLEYFDEVVGTDPSKLCVGTCHILKEKGTIMYSMINEGTLVTELSAKLPFSIDQDRVSFQLADASCLPLDLGSFDCVLACNLFCHLHTPLNFLNRLPELIRKEGIVLIASPYNIRQNVTPKENWIGGYTLDQMRITVFEGIKSSMNRHFDFVEELNQPFIVKKSDRNYFLQFYHLHIWRKR